jgi:hypothetical protein
MANAEPAGGGGGAWLDPTIYARKALAEQRAGKEMTLQEFRDSEFWTPPPADSFSKAGLAAAAGEAEHTGTSIFDPVICEIAYRWFCPPGGLVLDPLAGGSVRGIVASHLGRRYVGIELRPEQVAANVAQLGLAREPAPEWWSGDARQLDALAPGIEADMLFSCPPYWNLENYSDSAADLSNMALDEFTAAHTEIICKACELLKPDRFAVWVVGDVRDEDGCYIGLPGATVAAFETAGLRLYNEAVLVTAVGSLPIRTRRAFEGSRKLGRTHQNVLIFVKGDPKAATAAVGPVEFGELAFAPSLGAPNSPVDTPARGPVLASDIGGEI